MSNRLAPLRTLSDLLRDRDLAELAHANHVLAALSSQVSRMDADRKAYSAQQQDQAEPDFAQRSGALEKWHAFLDQKQAQLQRQIALQRAICDEARSKAKLSLGRATALRTLEDKHRK